MKYRYANTESGSLIDILTLASSNRRQYGQLICPGCRRELLPVLGERRERHFRHKHESASICTGETYLHALAKQTLVHAFLSALAEGNPFVLKRRVKQYCDKWERAFGLVCPAKDGTQEIDLTRYFDQIEEEASVEGFVADVLLISSRTDEKLLVEINVTHACEPKKLESGLRIAEVKVSTEDEARALEDGISELSEMTKFHNFRQQKPRRVPCSLECTGLVRAFHVYKSGKAYMQTDHPKRVMAVMQRPSTIYSRHVTDDTINQAFCLPSDFRDEASRAFQAGVDIKVCSLCRYAGFNTDFLPVFCKIKRDEVKYNEAATCSMYRPEEPPKQN